MANDYSNADGENLMDNLFQAEFDGNGNALDAAGDYQFFQSQPHFGADLFNSSSNYNLPANTAFGSPYTSSSSQPSQIGVPEGQGFSSYAQSLGSGSSVGRPLSDSSAFEGGFAQPFNFQGPPMGNLRFGHGGNMGNEGAMKSDGELGLPSHNSYSTPAESSGNSLSTPNTPLPKTPLPPSTPVNRKRQRESSGSSHRPRNRSYIPITQPAGVLSSSEQTPSSVDSMGLEFGNDMDEDVRKLLGDDAAQSWAEMREYQKEIEDDLRQERLRKEEMEQRGREYAERLQNEMNASHLPFDYSFSRPSTGYSNQSRITPNTLPPIGTRPTPWNPSSHSFGSPSAGPVSPEFRAGPSTERYRDGTIKAQHPKKKTPTEPISKATAGFIEISSENNDSGSESDDDFEVLGERSIRPSRPSQALGQPAWLAGSTSGTDHPGSSAASVLDLTGSSSFDTPLPPPFREIEVGPSSYGRGSAPQSSNLMGRILGPVSGMILGRWPAPSTPTNLEMQQTEAIREQMERIREIERRAVEQAAADEAASTQHLRSLVSNIRPDEDLGADDRTGTPDDMADGAALYKHQKLGLAWMIKMEEGSNKGGILADDMGLG